ncbi:MAG: outer membrane beta-barrel protein [Povalibacter sp.]
MFSTIQRFPLSFAVAALLIGSPALAEENPSGPYLGVGLGQFNTTVESLDGVDDAVKDLDTDSDTWKAFFGWRFSKYFSLEADYIDLGTPRGDFDASGSSGQYSMDLAGFGAYAIGTLPIGIFELSAKLGYYFHDITVDVDLDNFGSGNGNVLGGDNNGEALAYGIGAGVTFIDHINVNLEYERMEVDELKDTDTLWLTGAWRF